MRAILFISFLSAVYATDFIVNYDGYSVYEVVPRTLGHIQMLKHIHQSEDFDFWSDIHGLNRPVILMVKPTAIENFWEAMHHAGMKYNVLISNVQRTLDEEKQRQLESPKAEKGISFTEYHRYDKIVDYIHQLAVDYPDKASVEEFGTSYEGRPLYVIRIGTGPSTNPTILMEGGIHAREWISPALMLYIIKELVENENNAEMIANVNWVLVPVLNPDGYEYTHTDNRLWRKTRSIGTTCIGVDANRNFDFHWMGPGTSANECSETFAGPSAFSEPETLAFSKLALSLDNVFLYLGMHSYGQYLLYPWGFTTDLPENADEHQFVGDSVAEAIAAVDGTIYRAGTSPQLTYYVSGTTKDWMLGVGGTRLSYTIELPGGGSAGFDLPAERIIPVCEETWPGIVIFYNYVVENSIKEKL